MSITVEIEPSLEAALKLRAEEAGITLEAYLLHLAKRDVSLAPLDPRVEASVRISAPLRGKLDTLKDGHMNLDDVYGVP